MFSEILLRPQYQSTLTIQATFQRPDKSPVLTLAQCVCVASPFLSLATTTFISVCTGVLTTYGHASVHTHSHLRSNGGSYLWGCAWSTASQRSWWVSSLSWSSLLRLFLLSLTEASPDVSNSPKLQQTCLYIIPTFVACFSLWLSVLQVLEVLWQSRTYRHKERLKLLQTILIPPSIAPAALLAA